MEDHKYRSLMDYALHALARHAHTTHELLVKLRRRADFTEVLGGRVVERLTELHLIDDATYIRNQLANGAQFRHQGYLKIATKLAQKGVPLVETKKIWEELKKTENFSERDIALKALKKAKKRFERLPPEKQYQKRAQFLSSRGFSPEITFELAKPGHCE